VNNQKQTLGITSIVFRLAWLCSIGALIIAPKFSGAGLAVCLLIAIAQLLNNRPKLDAYDLKVVLMFLTYPLVCLVSMAMYGSVSARSLDTLSRFILVVPIYLYWRQNPASFQWFCMPAGLAALSLGAVSFYQYHVLQATRPDGGVNAITFAQLAMLLGGFAALMFSRTQLLSVWQKPHRVFTAMFAVVATGAALLAAVLSGSRGPLIAAPFLLLVLLYALPHARRAVFCFGLLTAVLLGCVFLFVEQDVLRIREALNDVVALNQGKANTSIGVRTEVWQAAWTLFQQNPIFGVGHNAFVDVVRARQSELGVGDYALGMHAHNDYLHALAEKGVIGLSALLLLFVGASVLVWRHTSNHVARAGVLIVTVCWLSFGLSQVQMAHQRIVLLELLALAFFLAYAKNSAGLVEPLPNAKQ
jgi:O-antigen ligase